jgi:hypothetical protein
MDMWRFVEARLYQFFVKADGARIAARRTTSSSSSVSQRGSEASALVCARFGFR